jgi:hypothetical protein
MLRSLDAFNQATTWRLVGLTVLAQWGGIECRGLAGGVIAGAVILGQWLMGAIC